MHQETQQRLSQAFLWMFECLLQRYRSKMVCRKGQGLWVQQTWVWHKPFWRRSPLTPPQSCHYLHRTGETDPWRAQTKPSPGSRRKDQWPHKRLTQTCPECPGVSGQGMGQQWPAAGCRALSVALHTLDLFKGVIIFITSTIIWPQVKQQGGNTASQGQKIELKIYWAWPNPSGQDSVSPQSVSPIRKLP